MKNVVLVYDLESCPSDYGIEMDKVGKIFEEHGVVLWTSKDNGTEPKLYVKEIGDKMDFRVIDLSTDFANRAEKDTEEFISKLLSKEDE